MTYAKNLWKLRDIQVNLLKQSKNGVAFLAIIQQENIKIKIKGEKDIIRLK